jgi:hypothetical protein
MKYVLSAVLISLCASAYAQDPEPSAGAVIEAMTAAGGTAGRMARYLAENGVAVEFDDSLTDGRSRRTWMPGPDGGMVRVVRIAPGYSGTPPLAGSLIAFEASELMYADMPESAEKRCVAVSLAAHAFFELGGSVAGASDAAWSESMAYWRGNSARKCVKKLRASGAASLGDIERRAQEGLDNLRRSRGEAVLFGALSSGRRGRIGWGMRSSYLERMIEGSKSRLKKIRDARDDYGEFKKYDKARRRALKG